MHVDDYAIKAWNEAYPEYTLTERLLKEKVHTCNHVVKEACSYLYEHQKLIAFCIVKTYQGNTPMPSYHQMGFISLFYVAPKFRRKGHGTAMLMHALTTLKTKGVKKVVMGQDMHNFFAGIPSSFMDEALVKCLCKVGFTKTGNAYDLVTHAPLVLKQTIPYQGRRLTQHDALAFLAFLANNFSPRWVEEAQTYFEKGGTGEAFFALFDQQAIIAFARINTLNSLEQMHNINWPEKNESLGGIGPLGVDHRYRKQGLGEGVVILGTNALFEQGVTRVVVDWTGLVAFYVKLGFSPYREYQNFTYLEE